MEPEVTDSEVCVLRSFLEKLKTNLVELDKLKLSNTKREIKYSMEKLSRLVFDFDKKVRDEELILMEPGMNIKPCLGKDVATQTVRVGGAHQILKDLEEGVEVEKVPDLISKRWDQSWFLNINETEVTAMNKEGRDRVVVFDLAKDVQTNFGKKMASRSSCLTELLERDTLKEGHILRDVRCSEIIAGEDVQVRERSDYVIIIDSNRGQASIVNTLMGGLKKLVEHLSDKAVFCIDEGDNKEILRKLLEYNARRYKRTFSILKGLKVKKPQIERGPETRKVAVALEGKSYAEVMKEVKNKVKADEIGEVLSIRRGKGEEAVIRVKGNETIAENVVQTLKGKLQGAKIDRVGRPPRKTFITIKDIEMGVKTEEVSEAIEKFTGEKCIGEPKLRPAFGETQAARALVTDRAARLLVENKRLRIGYVRCRIFKSQVDDMCYRCHEKGHIAKNCKGPDRRNTCFRCGEEGHKALDCSSAALLADVVRSLN